MTFILNLFLIIIFNVISYVFHLNCTTCIKIVNLKPNKLANKSIKTYFINSKVDRILIEAKWTWLYIIINKKKGKKNNFFNELISPFKFKKIHTQSNLSYITFLHLSHLVLVQQPALLTLLVGKPCWLHWWHVLEGQ